ncbi:MAG: sulfur transferase domain-containing protein, partial [Pseudomonadota bacterium]
SRRDRREAWASLLFADHGVLRLAYRNRHQVTPGLWRSAQPSPGDIAWARKAGIRTIVSLRGDGFGGDPLEQEACAREGLNFERLIMWSRAAPPKDSLRRAIERFPLLEGPILLHCKSGADRAGLAAALYLMIVDGAPVARASEQLSLRYGHIAQGRTGILDAFLNAYAATGEADGLGFEEWVERVYDPVALREGFHSSRAADALLTVLRRE